MSLIEESRKSLATCKASLARSERVIRQYNMLSERTDIPKWLIKFMRFILRSEKNVNDLLDNRGKLVETTIRLEKLIKEYEDEQRGK